MTMTRSVVGHVLQRLKDIGIGAVFGVPGDFAFGVQDAIVAEPGLDWVGCCNELNAGYAADGYARIRGIGAVSTTYGVGELSVINAIAGSYAENLPVIHLTGMPAMPVQHCGSLVHHTLGDGRFDLFARMADTVVCASAIMTPENVYAETERLLAAAVYERRPVYMAFPADLATQMPNSDPVAPTVRLSNPDAVRAAADAVCSELEAVSTACVLPGLLIDRLGLRTVATRFIDATGLPFATMFADKASLDERHPAFIGMYYGHLMNDAVHTFVENCERVIRIGTAMTDFNSGAFTARLDPARVIDIGHHRTSVHGKVFKDVFLGDLLAAVAARSPRREAVAAPGPPATMAPADQPQDPITAESLYPRWERFLADGDIMVAETGTVAMGLAFTRMPHGARFLNQTLWGSIGWATPAAFGAAVAQPGSRVVLFTGEGSHQLTAQEIGQFARRGLKPIVFVVNNNGYLIERLLCRDASIAYNDVAQWNYTELPHALGCQDWFTARVTTNGELDDALHRAATCGTGAYIEVVTDADTAPPAAIRLHDNAASLYGTP